MFKYLQYQAKHDEMKWNNIYLCDINYYVQNIYTR